MSSLRDYLRLLPDDEFLTVEDELSLDYFPTALIHQLQATGRSPILRIERPEGYSIPFVTNIFASADRIARILGVSESDFHRTPWARAVEEAQRPPTLVSSGPVQDVVRLDDVDVRTLPVSTHHAQDAGRYITSGILVTRDPHSGVRNLSFSRVQVRSADRLGISIHSRGQPWQFFAEAEANGEDLPVALVIGAHPALYLAASAKVPPQVDEYGIAGSILEHPVELVKCRTSDLEVPAQAEIVLEGRILANERSDEGPFGEYTGYTSRNSTRNVFQVDAITHRSEPIYLDISAGTDEHRRLGSSFKKSHVLAKLRETIPAVCDLNYPLSGTYYNAYISLHEPAKGQARHAMMLLFGLDSYVKNAIAVDDDIDVFDEPRVLWALATRFQADRDSFVVPDVICNRLDPSTVDGTAAKMGMDATRSADWTAERLTVPTEFQDWAKKFVANRFADNG